MKRVFLTLSIMIILILNLSVAVSAASAVLRTETSTDRIQPGKEIVVTVKLENIEGVSKGFNALTGILEYDDNIFEAIQSTDFKMQNSWDPIIYNPANKMFATAKARGIKSGEAIFELTLKAKADVKTGEYTVKIKEFTVSEGIEDIVLNEQNVKISIVEKNTSNNSSNYTSKGENNSESNSSEEANNVEENAIQNNNTTNTANTTNTDAKSQSDIQKIEQQSNTVWIIVAVIAAGIIVVIVAYMVKKKNDNM